MKFNTNWLLRCFDKTCWCILTQEIRGQYEWEASATADRLVASNPKIDDYQLTPILEKKRVDIFS